MPSLEDQEPRRIEELLAQMNIGRPPAQSDRSREKEALEKRLKVLRGEFDRNVFTKARQGGYSTETMLRMAAYKLGMSEDPVRDPVYQDDIQQR